MLLLAKVPGQLRSYFSDNKLLFLGPENNHAMTPARPPNSNCIRSAVQVGVYLQEGLVYSVKYHQVALLFSYS